MQNKEDFTNLRRTFSSKNHDESSVSSDPFSQFSLWMNEAMQSNLIDPTAMILATATKNGIPSVRTVLLKSFDLNGFVFFTNYKSFKAKDLEENPVASLLFLWMQLERQIRIVGNVEKVSEEESITYFATRPRASQLGAWASEQSSVIPSREFLEQKFEAYRKRFENQDIPLPPFWGGYRLIPNRFEFWQGRENRLHDRICYTLELGKWKIARLSP